MKPTQLSARKLAEVQVTMVPRGGERVLLRVVRTVKAIATDYHPCVVIVVVKFALWLRIDDTLLNAVPCTGIVAMIILDDVSDHGIACGIRGTTRRAGNSCSNIGAAAEGIADMAGFVGEQRGAVPVPFRAHVRRHVWRYQLRH